MKLRSLTLLVALSALLGSTACAIGSGQGGSTLTIYSSRTSSLVQPLLEAYAKESGVDLKIKYDSTAAIIATLQEEGDNSPADAVYIAESSGLGALSQGGLLSTLPSGILNKVDSHYKSGKGEWVGTSGRSKVLVYNTKTQNPSTLPTGIMDYLDPKWKGKIGWAPAHGEWQLTPAAIRIMLGDEGAKKWIEGMKANQAKTYPNLISIVQAAATGEIEVGFVNHYYVPRILKEQGEGFGARNFFLKPGDPGALVDVAGAGVLKRSKNQAGAQRFIEYLLSDATQKYFVEQTYEYPMIKGINGPAGLPALGDLKPPDIDQDRLSDVPATLKLLRDAGVLP